MTSIVMYVYVVFVYMHITIINKDLLTTTYIALQGICHLICFNRPEVFMIAFAPIEMNRALGHLCAHI